jgi:ubiquinone/menaquinone biosynthesis C-methylase UbiE
MNEFDKKAADWDRNTMHWDRSEAIANEIKKLIPLQKTTNVMEYGAGTGITSFLLKELVGEITLMDNSPEMVKIMNEKIKAAKTKNLKALNFDLEHSEFLEGKFDLIFTQMVLHHVVDIDSIIKKFSTLVSPGGFLAIADLYEEDGSFHGEGFTGHKGFNIDNLSDIMRKNGFTGITNRTCFTIDRKISESETMKFDVFLLIGTQSK